MSDARSIDAASRRLIREELLTNILVEAGAGSGKTQMLAERMAGGVAAGVYQIEHLAAVTFTRKAASELRGRFHLALEQELAKGGDAERRHRIEAALSNLERFFAGTIHSFCARLLRERPVESGVSPGFTELDEVQDLELRRRAWREFVTAARAEGDADMLALVDTDVRIKDLDSAFAIICDNDDVDFPPGAAACPDAKAAWRALERFWAELKQHLPPAIHPQTTCKIQKAAIAFDAELRVSRYRVDRPSVLASLLEPWDVESKIIQYQWSANAADRKRLRDLIQPMHARFLAEVVEPYLGQWRQYVYRLSVTLLTRARQAAARERRRLNSLNYGDLLNLTARVLRENRAVRLALQEKFRHVLVDEFQDTDPVQAEIVFLLAGEDDPQVNDKVDWRTVALRPGALFVVGDPKQSIYRFRRADIDIYNIVRGRFSDPAVGRVVPLTLNFRSAPQLCTWVNEVFATRFPAEPSTHAPRFASLDPDPNQSRSGGVFTLTHHCEVKEALAADAQRIAAFIKSEVDAGNRQFSDFMILTRRKRDRIAPYARALDALNIPIEVSGAGAFGDSPEVEALTMLLRALADPQDGLALVALLRGPLFGLSDADLFAFKQSGGWFSIFQGSDSPADRAGDSVRSALAALRDYHRWTRVLPAAAALERVLEHTGFLAFAGTTPGGVNAGDVLHAVDRVRRIVEEGGSLADAADALDADAEAVSEVESLPLEPGRTDVVRVMNLHKAKGLEADVVFLADPAGGFPPRIDVHIERTGREAQGWLEIVRRNEAAYWSKRLGQHADWDAHVEAERPYRTAEDDRLFYVAATRARSQLVVSRTVDKPKYPAWGALDACLAGAEELPATTSAIALAAAPMPCAPQEEAEAAVRRRAAHAAAMQPSWSATSATAEARHIARITRSVESAPDDPSKVVATDTPAHRADAGQAWGTLIHGLLEHAMRHKSATRDDLRRLAMWLTLEEPRLRPVIEEALDTVERTARAEFWQRARSHESSVEAPFAIAEPGRVLNGVIDLMFKSDDAWQIVDYKTDVAGSALTFAYEQQLKMYERALAAVGIRGASASVQSVRIKADEPLT